MSAALVSGPPPESLTREVSAGLRALWSIRGQVVPMPEVWNHKWKIKLLPTHSAPPSAFSLGLIPMLLCSASRLHPRRASRPCLAFQDAGLWRAHRRMERCKGLRASRPHCGLPRPGSASPHSLPRSPPRPSPGSLHYSDEDVTKYNDLIQAESSSLTEKPSEISDSQVRGGRWGQSTPSQSGGLHERRLRGSRPASPTGHRNKGGPANDPEVTCRPAATSQALIRVCIQG